MNATLTATWTTPEQADTFGYTASIEILTGRWAEGATPATEYGTDKDGVIAGEIADEYLADAALTAAGLRRRGQWTTQDGYQAAEVEAL